MLLKLSVVFLNAVHGLSSTIGQMTDIYHDREQIKSGALGASHLATTVDFTLNSELYVGFADATFAT